MGFGLKQLGRSLMGRALKRAVAPTTNSGRPMQPQSAPMGRSLMGRALKRAVAPTTNSGRPMQPQSAPTQWLAPGRSLYTSAKQKFQQQQQPAKQAMPAPIGRPAVARQAPNMAGMNVLNNARNATLQQRTPGFRGGLINRGRGPIGQGGQQPQAAPMQPGVLPQMGPVPMGRGTVGPMQGAPMPYKGPGMGNVPLDRGTVGPQMGANQMSQLSVKRGY